AALETRNLGAGFLPSVESLLRLQPNQVLRLLQDAVGPTVVNLGLLDTIAALAVDGDRHLQADGPRTVARIEGGSRQGIGVDVGAGRERPYAERQQARALGTNLQVGHLRADGGLHDFRPARQCQLDNLLLADQAADAQGLLDQEERAMPVQADGFAQTT